MKVLGNIFKNPFLVRRFLEISLKNYYISLNSSNLLKSHWTLCEFTLVLHKLMHRERRFNEVLARFECRRLKQMFCFDLAILTNFDCSKGVYHASSSLAPKDCQTPVYSNGSECE